MFQKEFTSICERAIIVSGLNKSNFLEKCLNKKIFFYKSQSNVTVMLLGNC